MGNNNTCALVKKSAPKGYVKIDIRQTLVSYYAMMDTGTKIVPY